MKILQLNHFFYPGEFGGVSKVMRSISKELARRGHFVVVYTTNAFDPKRKFIIRYKTKYIIDNVVVYYFNNTIQTNKLYLSITLIDHLCKNLANFDILHLHSWRQIHDFVACNYAIREHIPYVFQPHGSLAKVGVGFFAKRLLDLTLGLKLLKRILKKASKVIALTRVEADQCRSMGVPEEKIAIIPNGIDLSEYAELPPKGAFKRKFNIPEDKKIILYLGRIHKTKGIDFLVRAYAYLTRKMNFKDAVLIIAGPDDGYLSEIKSLVQGLSISNSVLFTGPLYGEDKLAAYVDSEVYVLPSRYEMFPMAVLEAYACGKPVVASKVGGLKDLVINGETGFLIEVGSVDQLAKAILFLLNNINEAEEMGLRGKQLVKNKFSIEAVIGKLEAIYKEVVEA